MLQNGIYPYCKRAARSEPMARVFEKIIVGSNGSPESEHAAGVAISLAAATGAKLVLIGVTAPLSAEARAEGYASADPARSRRQLTAQLERLATSARTQGVEVLTEIADGDAEKQIGRHAASEGADLIVIGHRNVSRIRHWLERSTGEALLNRTKTSILVVHTPTKAQGVQPPVRQS